MPMGEPGWPELAACTASMHSVRIVLMASFSMAALSLATVRPVFIDQSPRAANSRRPNSLLLLKLLACLLADEVELLAPPLDGRRCRNLGKADVGDGVLDHLILQVDFTLAHREVCLHEIHDSVIHPLRDGLLVDCI